MTSLTSGNIVKTDSGQKKRPLIIKIVATTRIMSDIIGVRAGA